MATEQSIPVVNLQDFLSADPAKRENFVKVLGDALTDLGFFAVTHHGVDSALIKRCYGLCEAFFTQDNETKCKSERPELKGQRGFTSFGRESAKDAKTADLKEYFHVGRELDSSHPDLSKYGPNIWPEPPDVPDAFRPSFLDLYAQLEQCAQHLLEACALYLEQSESLFADMARDGDTILRIIHYPPVPEDAEPSAMRAAAHEDINLITLLCEATEGGLELLQRDGTWRAIHALDGQIIVDAGDMLQNLTNGILKSTTHRVVNPDNNRSRRFSMPYFVHPRGEVDLSPLSACIEREGAQKYPNISASEYLLQRLHEMGLHKEKA